MIFIHNNATRSGGAIYAENITKFMGNDNVFVNNSASNGGAVSILRESIDVEFKDVQFRFNEASKQGGAVYLSNNKEIKINNGTIQQNKAE